MSPNLNGMVCLVTGGSKGIGRGIALQLGGAGATVYVTGRNKGELDSCAADIKGRGGRAVPVVVDHSKPEEVEKLFEQIKKEQRGKLDLLVNNAYAAVGIISETMGQPFWEAEPVNMWDTVNDVGLRNHYICTVHAARMMIPRKSGLIVNISSTGGLKYLFNVAYGVGKAGLDRLAQDAALELKPHGVTVVALWPGPVKTEKVQVMLANPNAPDRSKMVFGEGESLEFSGKAVSHLAADVASNPQALAGKSGRVLITADLAREYGFVDEDGTITGDFRSVSFLLKMNGWDKLAAVTPGFVRIPCWLMYLSAYKF